MTFGLTYKSYRNFKHPNLLWKGLEGRNYVFFFVDIYNDILFIEIYVFMQRIVFRIIIAVSIKNFNN